ncbi:HDOD domain protein (plasmid) [Variovorax sp. PBL-H6]|nr:HDOD domain protein [Variovorax sp. PBL-H6]VTU43723.1 HDOD domain protein [Variovorax sp. SRS16]VTU43788.1 HDOD domain protein [Variovorax sp. PBL-E5]
MGLTSTERTNPRTFELLTLKDPAAVARLISLSNAAGYHRSGNSVKSVRDAVRVIGTRASYDALLAIFTLDLVTFPTHLQPLRNFLTRHIFSVLATARRIAPYASPEHVVADQTHLAFVAIVDKLGIALAMGRMHGATMPAMMAVASDSRHWLHGMPEFDEAFELSAQVARSWDMSEEVPQDLEHLARWAEHMPVMSSACHHVLAAEALLDAKKGMGNDALLEAPFRDWPVIQNLFTRGVDPMSLVADW